MKSSIIVINFLNSTLDKFSLQVENNSSITGKELFDHVTKAFSLPQDKHYALMPLDTMYQKFCQTNIITSECKLSCEKNQYFSLIDSPARKTKAYKTYFAPSTELLPVACADNFKLDRKITISEVRSLMFNLYAKDKDVHSITFGIRSRHAIETEWKPAFKFFSGIDLDSLDTNEIVFIVHLHLNQEEIIETSTPLPETITLKIVCLFKQTKHPLVSEVTLEGKQTFETLQQHLSDTYFPEEERNMHIFMYSFSAHPSKNLNDSLLTPRNFHHSCWKNGIFLMPYRKVQKIYIASECHFEIAKKSLRFCEKLKVDKNFFLCHFLFQLALNIQQFPNTFKVSLHEVFLHQTISLFDPTLTDQPEYEQTLYKFFRKNESQSFDLDRCNFVIEFKDPLVNPKITQHELSLDEWKTIGKTCLNVFSKRNSKRKRKYENVTAGRKKFKV